MAFDYVRTLTVDHTKCGSGNSSNFPALVYISDSTFKDTGNSGHVRSSAGADILFFAEASGATQLESEIESYDNINGILWAWVNVPTLSASVDTVFYVLYGNASPPSRTTMTWNGYEGVWHLGQASSAQALDSTANAHNSTVNSTTQTTGQISKGQQFVAASTNSVEIPAISALGSATKAVLSAWVKRNSTNSLLGVGQSNTPPTHLFDIEAYSDGKIYLNVQVNTISGDFATNDTNWHLVHMVYDGAGSGNSGRLIGYLDGVAQTLHFIGTIPATLPASDVFYIGRDRSDAFYSSGYHDETRLSVGSVAHGTQDWATAEWNNQSNPGSFLTIGAEASAAGTIGYLKPSIIRPAMFRPGLAR